ncbi:MAG: sigma-70 family RNA polymerase sigma factor [Planctomycetota bacterium]|nr:sigma-70 family RNA polymerase sigma factor [Planctomycetota bacterium]
MTEERPKDPDIEVMLRFQKGDEKAFEVLVTKHQRNVLNLIYRYLGNATQADDAAQEVFLKLYRARHKYTPKAKFSTWLYRITVNHCLNEIRSRKNQPASLDPIDDMTEQGEARAPDDQIHQGELRRAVKEAIDSLPENQRMAVILARYEEMSYEEISETMKTSLEAVKSLLHRAKESLQQKLSGYDKQ